MKLNVTPCVSLYRNESVFKKRLSNKFKKEFSAIGISTSSKIEQDDLLGLYRGLVPLGRKGTDIVELGSHLPFTVTESVVDILVHHNVIGGWLYGYNEYILGLKKKWKEAIRRDDSTGAINSLLKEYQIEQSYHKEISEYYYGALKAKQKSKDEKLSNKKNYGDNKPGLIVNGKVLEKDGTVKGLGYYDSNDFFIFEENIDEFDRELYTKFVFNTKDKISFWATRYSELLNSGSIERGICPLNYKEYL